MVVNFVNMVSMPWQLYCQGKSPPSTHCVGGCVGPRGILDVLETGEVMHLL